MKKPITKDGWHEMDRGHAVYTKNGLVMRATKADGRIPAAVYRWDVKSNAWKNVSGEVSYDTLRRRRGSFLIA